MRFTPKFIYITKRRNIQSLKNPNRMSEHSWNTTPFRIKLTCDSFSSHSYKTRKQGDASSSHSFKCAFITSVHTYWIGNLVPTDFVLLHWFRTTPIKTRRCTTGKELRYLKNRNILSNIGLYYDRLPNFLWRRTHTLWFFNYTNV